MVETASTLLQAGGLVVTSNLAGRLRLCRYALYIYISRIDHARYIIYTCVHVISSARCAAS